MTPPPKFAAQVLILSVHTTKRTRFGSEAPLNLVSFDIAGDKGLNPDPWTGYGFARLRLKMVVENVEFSSGEILPPTYLS